MSKFSEKDTLFAFLADIIPEIWYFIFSKWKPAAILKKWLYQEFARV